MSTSFFADGAKIDRQTKIANLFHGQQKSASGI